MNREKPKQKVFRKGSRPTPTQRIHKRYEDWGRTGFFIAQGMENSISVWGWYLNAILIYPLSLRIQSVSKSCQLQLQNPFRIQPSLITSTATTLAQATISSYLDNIKNLLTFLFPILHAPKSPSQSIFHTAVSQRNIYHLTEEDSYLFVCLPF